MLQVVDGNLKEPKDHYNILPACFSRLNLPLSLLQDLKSTILGDPATYAPNQLHFFEEGQIDGLPSNILRVGMKGNPSFGDIRIAMIGVRNETNTELCGEVWFNELRLSELQNQGGWAAVAAMDANFADFANLSATGRVSTIGFGSLEQGPNDRSREDVQEYDLVTNLNLGQMLPKKWGIQLPFNYGRSWPT